MKRNGYTLYKTLEFDDIYVKNDFLNSIQKIWIAEELIGVMICISQESNDMKILLNYII